MRNVTLTFRKSKAPQETVLPQADIVRGVAGSVFAVQIGGDIFAVDMLSVVNGIAAAQDEGEEPVQTVAATVPGAAEAGDV